MQNWKSFIALTSSYPSRCAAANTTLQHQQVYYRLALSNPPQSRSFNTRSAANNDGSSKRTAKTTTISSTRKQSTTQAKLATRQQQVPLLRKELLGSVPAEDEDFNEQEDKDDDKLIYDKVLERQQRLNNSNNNLLSSIQDDLKQLEVHKFANRHIGPSESEIKQMLDNLDLQTLDQLIDQTIPEQIRLKRDLKLPKELSEHELLEQLKLVGSQNESIEWRSLIGLGYYDCVTPTTILRNIFENPGWTTAYTAYQAEIAQGRLESLMNYQTMVSDLTGLDVANASLLDESTAVAEAMQVCLRHDKLKRNKLLLSSRCHPQTLAVVETRAKALGIDLDYFDELELDTKTLESLQQYSGLLVQYPNSDGYMFDLNLISKPAHGANCLVVCATDLMACTLFKPPGDFEYPADLAVGTSQRFGIPLNYGGPHAGFLACKQALVRLIPGRVVGLTRDSNGNQAYRFALQTREQHIRRDKATSNICTAQALLANMSAMYAVYHGPDGLKQIASDIHTKTSLLAHLIRGTIDNDHVEILNDGSFFDTLNLRVNNLKAIKERAQEAKFNLRYDDNEQEICISLDETTKLSDIFKLANLFNDNNTDESSQSSSKRQQPPKSTTFTTPLNNQLYYLKRTTNFLTHPTFNSYKSEPKLVRYMKSLENKDISLTHSMIPLGSCTMKLNATTQMIASSWPEFTKCHPFQPQEQCQGYMKLFNELDEYLCEITGYDRISFQPNSGAQGEYTGLRVIKSYLESIGQADRNVCLIPISAHGTNPASAQMAGFKIQTIKVKENGNIDLDNLSENIEKYKENLACLMITYPSTFGVFEESIKQVCDMIHENGGQVYLDGANMNAQVGLCRPGDYGSDVSHLNLHKTFCIPHGGGGPGAGPIGVKKHLIPFLPSHPLINSQVDSNEQSFGTVSSSMWGSPAILPISWSYIRLMSKNLKKASQVAILNANYMRKKLENDYKILFKGAHGNVAHEFIIDCRPFKKSANIEAVDIAKRLQDFGFHAPTVSWPVTNTLMIEPTESEDKDQLDKYCEALLIIRQEIEDIEKGLLDKLNNPIKNAPHTQRIVCSSEWARPYSREKAAFPAEFVTPVNKVWPTVGRVDDAYGDTNLFCSCQPVTSTD